MFLTSKIIFYVYKTVLLEYGISKVKQIFPEKPLIENRPSLSMTDFYSLIYNEELPRIDSLYMNKVLANLEEVIKERGEELSDFIHLFLTKYTEICLPATPKVVLSTFEPYLQKAFEAEDIRDFIADMIPKIHYICAPDYLCYSMKTRVDDWVIGYIEVTYSPGNSIYYPFNCYEWEELIVRETPACLGAPRFDTINCLTDIRAFDRILPKSLYEIINGEVFVKGKKVGQIMLFSDFVSLQEYFLPQTVVDDCWGVYIYSDISHLGEKFQLLQNCFYGAPYFLFKIGYKHHNNNDGRCLKTLVNPEIHNVSEYDSLFKMKHEALIASYNKELKICFNPETEILLVNSTPFLRSAPAKLLYRFLKDVLENKSCQYHYSALRVDPFFNFTPHKANINVRIKRLMEKLENNYPCMKITIVGRGIFEFSANANIELSEI